MRKAARRHVRNLRVKTRLKRLEKRYLDTLQSGPPEARLEALRQLQSALDKAAKSGVIHEAKARRKKSRLAQRLRLAA